MYPCIIHHKKEHFSFLKTISREALLIKKFFFFLVALGLTCGLMVAGNLDVNDGATVILTNGANYDNINVASNGSTSNSNNLLSIGSTTTPITVAVSSNTWCGYSGNSNIISVAQNTTLQLSVSGTNAIGYTNSANNSLIVQDGGKITQAAAGATINVGFASGSTANNTLVSSNSGSLIEVDNINHNGVGCGTYAGGDGTVKQQNSGGIMNFNNSSCFLNINSGGNVQYDNINVGAVSGAFSNNITVTGTNSQLNSSAGNLNLGVAAGAATLNVTSAGQLITKNLLVDQSSTSGSNIITVSNSGSIVATNIALGNGGYGQNSMTVSSTGSVSATTNFLLGADAGVGSNSVVVMGTGSILNGGSLLIGVSNSSHNTLILSNGGGSTFSTIVIGFGQTNCSSFSNAITVSDAGSILNNNGGTLVVGDSGHGNSLTISNGGKVVNCGTNYVGANFSGFGGALSSNNSVLVTGSNSEWQAGTLIEGSAGGGNHITVSNTALLKATVFQIGTASTSSNNSLTIDGATVLATNTNLAIGTPYSFILGVASAGNTLTITNGGVLSNSLGVIGYDSSASNNRATVTGTNSTWINTNGFYVGFQGNSNSLTVSDGGKVIVNTTNSSDYQYAYIGLVSSSNSVTITGTNSLLSVSGQLNIGYLGGSNQLIISNGGVVIDSSIGTNFSESFAAMIGTYSNDNTVQVESDGSWLNSGNVAVGYNGSSNRMLIDGGTVSVSNTYIGYSATASNNNVKLTTNGKWTNNGDVFLGYAGSANQILATNGAATIFSTNLYIGYTADSSNNNITLDSTSVWSNENSIYVGYSGDSNNITISGGATVTSSNTYISYNNGSSNNNITVTGSNSLLSNSGVITIGGSGSSGSMTVESNAIVYAPIINIDQGTLSTYNTNSLSNAAIKLGGFAQSGILSLKGNLTLTSLDWKSNGLIGVNPGQSILTVTTLSSSDGTGGGFDFSGTSFNNDTNKLVKFTSNSVSSTNYYVEGVTGYTFVANSNDISGYFATDANITSSVSMTLTNNFTANELTLLSDSNTTTIASNGFLNITSNMVLSKSATLINNGNVRVEGALFNFTNSIIVNNTNGLIVAEQNITNNAQITNFGTIEAENLYNNNLGGYLTNASNALVDITNALYNYGTIVNNGTIVAGDIYNYGTWSGAGTNTMTNTNTFHQEGTLVLSPGTTTLGGNVVAGSNSIITDQIISGENGNYGQLVVDGVLALAGIFNLTFLPNSTATYGQLLKSVIIAREGIISNFVGETSSLPGMRGRLLFTNNNTEMDVLLAPANYALVAQNANQTNVAVALNSFIPATNGDQLTVSLALDEMTAAQYPAAFMAIAPQLYQSLSTLAFNVANANDMALSQRLGALRALGSGFTMNGFSENTPFLQGQEEKQTKDDILIPGVDKHWGVFVDGNGIFANASSGNMLPSYNSESGGVTTGLSYQWNDHVLSGLYSGYQGAYTKYTTGSQGALVDNAVRFGFFGSYGDPDGKGFYLNGLAGGAYNNYNMQRTIAFSTIDRTASSMPDAGELDTMLATGYDIKRGNFTFGPTSSLQYIYFNVNPFNESGAQSLNLDAQGWNTSSMIYSLGSHVTYTWQVNKEIVIMPQLSLNWQHEFLQNSYAINSTLNGSSPTFANYSAAPLRDTFFPSLGFTVALGNRCSTSLTYSASAGNQDLMSQNIFWNLDFKF